MQFQITYLIAVFFIYSFGGYICEIICSSIVQKKIVNRGFLCGPYCPIYGVGSLFILFCLLKFESDPVIVFILGALITTCLEYFTGFVLEKIFHNKWWDYTGYIANLNGRVCLQNTLLFGFGSLVIIYVTQPTINKILESLSPLLLNIITYTIFVIFLIDCIYSCIIAYNLRNRIIICEELKSEKLAKIPGMLEKIIKERVEKFKAYPKRLLEAFPNLKETNKKEFDIMNKLTMKKKRKKKC